MKASADGAFAKPANDKITEVTKKYSASPLIDPAVCLLVLILPAEHDPSLKPACPRGGHHREVTTLLAAAEIVEVPTFVCQRSPKPLKSTASPHHTFICEPHGCIWKNDAFRTALDVEDRTTLVLAGYWLDREVVMAALYALADCYDVYVLIDASPARSREAARLTEARLLQAGAVPLLTEQVVHEWIVETPSDTQRAALTALLR